MSAELQFAETEDTKALLQDVLAFIDNNALSGIGSGSPTSVWCPLYVNGDRAKQRRRRIYSPDYDRRRREKKKAERENLRTQVNQYESQLKLLRLRHPIPTPESKWRWLDVVVTEEEKRRKAEELNHQLKGLLVRQLNAAQHLQDLITQEAGFAARVQIVLSSCVDIGAEPKKLSTFTGLGDVTAHLKGTLSYLYAASNYVFQSNFSLNDDASSFGDLTTTTRIRNQDPLAGSCIELVSLTPLSCNLKTAAPLLWKMLVTKQAFGPKASCYTMMRTSQSSSTSAEMEYSIEFGVSDVLDGATLMEKHEQENGAVMVWTSMLVQRDGRPFFKSQGWISISEVCNESRRESVMHMCNWVSGQHLGVPCDSDEVDVAIARKHQVIAKTRLGLLQERFMERAEREKTK